MPKCQIVELAMAANVHLFRATVGAAWNPRRIFIRHAAPDTLELHRQVFRCRCEFSSEFNGSFHRSRREQYGSRGALIAAHKNRAAVYPALAGFG